MFPRSPHRTLLNTVAAAIVIMALTPAPSLAVGEAAKLNTTRKQIQEIRKRLAAAQGRAAVIQKEVKRLEGQMADLDRQIATGRHDVSALESEIRTAQRQINEMQSRYRKAVEASNERARRLYKAGPAKSLAMLFSIDSIMELARLQVWWEKSSEQDSRTMVEAARLKSALQERKNDLNATRGNLNKQRSWLEERKELLAGARADRAKALAAVQKEIDAAKRHIEGLEADSNRLEQVLRQTQSRTSGGGEEGAASRAGFMRPVAGRITSGFGRRWGRAHTGVDMDGSTGDPIRAAKAGRILGVSCGGGYGNCTVIDHGGGITTLYAHMSRKAVSGGTVERGQVIGYVGCTGSCTGSHLHFEVRVNGAPQNPMRYL
ncbi:MAG: peptidoglycan DD-metalloendopeptidase family protein [Actinomycetota bacterium]|nr:peptidoglycan DD-metalloendopeptidase family protein [Actinomycetota bacterium]